jgi:4-hydroxy-3-polyprenylbenzoate decarboxylase
MEDCYLAWTTERLFLPMLQMVMPEIKDYLLPWEGVFHSIAVISIEKEYPGHAAKIAYGLWGSGQMSFAKALVIVDDKSLLKDGRRLFKYILDTVDFSLDVVFARGILDVLDHSSPEPLFGSKIAIDATDRISGEEKRGKRTADNSALPPSNDAELLEGLQQKDNGFVGLRTIFPGSEKRLMAIAVNKTSGQSSRHYIDLLERDAIFGGVSVIYDAEIDITDDSLLLWKAFNNVDPARDIGIGKDGVVIDATKKGRADGHERPWPDDIKMTPEIKRKVEKLLQKNPKG